MTLLLKNTLLLIWLELLKIEHQITRIPGLINYCTTQKHETNSFGTVTWFVKVQWAVAQCHKWVKNMWKAPGQHKSNTIPHATHLGRWVLIREPHWEVQTQNERCTPSCVRLVWAVAGGDGAWHPHQPGQTNPSRYQQIPTGLEASAFLVKTVMTKIWA